MPGGMPFSRWSALPEKMISMRRISMPAPIPQRSRRDRRIIASKRMGKLRQRNGQRLVMGSFRGFGQVRPRSTAIGKPSRKPDRAIGGYKFGGRGGCCGRIGNLPAKNTLTAADAKMVEERFKARLSTMSDSPHSDGPSEGPPLSGTPDGLAPAGRPHALAEQGAVTVGGPDAGASHKASRRAKKQPRRDVVHALGKTVRLRDKDHRKFVLRQACLVCGRVPSDPHHLTFTQPRALGRRVSDEFIVPVCRVHHRELHRSGDEAAWWRKLNIDPVPVALRLWQQTRADGELAPVTQA